MRPPRDMVQLSALSHSNSARPGNDRRIVRHTISHPRNPSAKSLYVSPCPSSYHNKSILSNSPPWTNYLQRLLGTCLDLTLSTINRTITRLAGSPIHGHRSARKRYGRLYCIFASIGIKKRLKFRRRVSSLSKSCRRDKWLGRGLEIRQRIGYKLLGRCSRKDC